MNLVLFVAMPIVPIAFILDQSGVLPGVADGAVRITISDVLTLFVIGAYVVQVLFRRRSLTFSRIEVVTFLLMLTLLSTSLIAVFLRPSFDFAFAVTALARLAAQAVYLFCLSNLITRPEHYRHISRMVFVVGLFCALNVYLGYGLGQFGIKFGESQNVTEDWGGTSRAFGLVGDSVGFILVLPMCWAIATRKYLWAAFFAASIILTGTRGAIICMAVSVIGLATFEGVRRQMRIVPLIMGLIVVSGLGYGLMKQLNLTSRFDVSNSYADSGTQRLATWILAVRMFSESPATVAFGVGYNAYIYEAENYGAAEVFAQGGLSWEDGGRRQAANATNPYLQMLVDGGLFALAAYIWFLFAALKTFRTGVRSVPEMDAFFIGAWAWVFGLAVGSQWAVWMLPSSYVTQMLWPALAVVVAAQRMAAPAAKQSPVLEAYPATPALVHG